MPLSAVEGFVLSRVDGVSSARDIADSTGIGEELALAALQRLVSLGLVRNREKQPSAAPPRETAQASKRFARPPSVAPQRIHTEPPPAGTPRRLYDPQELEEDVALDDTRKRRVLDVFYKLGTADHYDLLEVGRDATKTEVRDAYFSLSKEFHPDTAFGKMLGTYKAKMEKIFTSATTAYDVLSRKARRAEYDATLPPALPNDASWRERRRERGEGSPGAAQSKSGGAALPQVSAPTALATTSEAPSSHPPAAHPAARRPLVPPPTRVPSSGPPGAVASAVTDRPASTPSGAPPATPVVPPEPPRSPASSQPPTADQVKRSQDLLRMRLAGGRARPAANTSTDGPDAARPSAAPPSVPAQRSEGARADVLRGLAGSLRDASNFTGSGQSLRRHLIAAADAERSGDISAALNALRLAKALAPDDAQVTTELERLEFIRAAEEAPMFEQRAQSEQQSGKWSQAALSWMRVVKGRPNDAVAARHCAHALLEADLDLKTARDLALRALDAAPNVVANRTLLARIYIAAGMRSNARRELEAATKLDPDSEIVKNLLRELG